MGTRRAWQFCSEIAAKFWLWWSDGGAARDVTRREFGPDS
jgi:hypothetical protein